MNVYGNANTYPKVIHFKLFLDTAKVKCEPLLADKVTDAQCSIVL